MTITKAFSIAMKNPVFNRHYHNVMEAKANGTQSSCMIFAIDGECFYYGFDGVKLQKGKHTEKQSAYLLIHGMAYIIR